MPIALAGVECPPEATNGEQMSDLYNQSGDGHARQTLTVAQVTAYIKSLFTMDPMLGDVWISGEVSNFKLATSGHCYLTLKDGDACLKSVIWRTAARGITLPRDGDAVLAHGYISVYESQGAY